MAVKTDEELNAYIENRERFLPDTVFAAVAELQNRGEAFSTEELEIIREDMKARRELALDEPGQSIFLTSGWKYKLVADEYAPAFFSQLIIFLFSIIPGVFFSSILLAINVSKTPNRNKAPLVVLYGFAFELFQPFLMAGGSVVGLILIILSKVLGGFMLTSFFWNAYLGNGTLYRARPFWVPLIVAVALVVLNYLSVDYLVKSGYIKR
jgi:hypothetical protein